MAKFSTVKKAVLIAAVMVFFAPSAMAAPVTTVKGSHGELLTTTNGKVASGTEVLVSGSHFDESVGIYLAYCVLPKKGEVPTPCGGGINKAGVGDASYWISSNPPPYGKGLTIPYQPGGRFTQKVKVVKKIGTTDCTKVTCAITVRADHLNTNDRSYDIFIPITIK